MKISIVMTTYNRAGHLRRALRSHLGQTEGDFEIVVADDGSTDETPAVVEEFRELAPFDVSYVRQEHLGFRRAACANLGIRATRYDWLLFTDCDSLAFPDLVATHRQFARPDRMLCGGYLRLDKNTTRALDDADAESSRFTKFVDEEGQRELRRKHRRARWEILTRRRRRPHNHGLNFSVSREALLRINGYDEEYEGWGSADGDVRERLRAVGVRPYSLIDRAVVLHMWHATDPTKQDSQSLRANRARARRRGAATFCEHGLQRSE